ncbi:MAG: glycerophosphodiester phosphodiesterase [Alphaproteobacteria bacterium]
MSALHRAGPARPSDFQRIAHRGASAECPENTLVSFRRAMELGATMIECDLQLTADGHVVVFHDWSVERTTSGAGTVRDLPLAALRELDAGSWKDARFAGERVPTLEEILDATAGRVALNLELKSRRSEALLALSVLRIVEQHAALDRVLFSSFDMGLLERIRDASPEARIAVLWAYPPFDDALRIADELGAAALHPPDRGTDAAIVGRARERGLAINVWTVNSLDRMLELVGFGVAGVISDHPGRLLEARARLLGS